MQEARARSLSLSHTHNSQLTTHKPNTVARVLEKRQSKRPQTLDHWTMAFRDFAARYAISTSVELDAQRRPALDADDGEAIAATFPAVDLVAGDDEPPAAANGTADAADADAPPLPAALRLGTGTLYVTTRRVVWVADDAPDGAPAGSASPPQAVALTYRQVVMHAVATDAASFSRPCVYLQLDAGDEGMMEEEEDEAPGPAPELRMVPADASQGESFPDRSGLFVFGRACARFCLSLARPVHAGAALSHNNTNPSSKQYTQQSSRSSRSSATTRRSTRTRTPRSSRATSS